MAEDSADHQERLQCVGFLNGLSGSHQKDSADSRRVINCLLHDSACVRSSACRALSRIQLRDQQIAAQVASLLDDNMVGVCCEAAQALGGMKACGFAFVDRLVAQVNAANEGRCCNAELCVVTSAVEALGQLGPQAVEHAAVVASAVELRGCRCSDPFGDWRRPRSVMMALAAMGASQHTETITRYLSHESASVRQDAVEALGHLVSTFVSSSMGHIERGLADEDDDVIEAAGHAIEKIQESCRGASAKRARITEAN